MESDFLSSAIKQFEYYKMLGDKTLAQVPDDKLTWQYNTESNSLAQIVKHLWGNMLSRWTNFLTSDGEKGWRNREAEFDNDLHNRTEIEAHWNEGWACLFTALQPLTTADLSTVIYIRNQGHTVLEAINRQLAHYPYHVGQMLFLGKMICGSNWQSLSIPKGASQQYNTEKFNQEKHRQHFTEEFLPQKQ
jgi:hypothetical protein